MNRELGAKINLGNWGGYKKETLIKYYYKTLINIKI